MSAFRTGAERWAFARDRASFDVPNDTDLLSRAHGESETSRVLPLAERHRRRELEDRVRDLEHDLDHANHLIRDLTAELRLVREQVREIEYQSDVQRMGAETAAIFHHRRQRSNPRA